MSGALAVAALSWLWLLGASPARADETTGAEPGAPIEPAEPEVEPRERFFRWTDTSLTLLPWGSGFEVDPREQSTFTLEHAHDSAIDVREAGLLGLLGKFQYIQLNLYARAELIEGVERGFEDLQITLTAGYPYFVWVKGLVPERRLPRHLDHSAQLGARAVHGHGVWLDEDELRRCHETGTTIAPCPASNLFLGSSLFKVDEAKLGAERTHCISTTRSARSRPATRPISWFST